MITCNWRVEHDGTEYPPGSRATLPEDVESRLCASGAASPVLEVKAHVNAFNAEDVRRVIEQAGPEIAKRTVRKRRRK